MTALWHLIWPGWGPYISSLAMGVLTLPILIPVQMLLMRTFAKVHIRHEVERQVALRLGQPTPQKPRLRDWLPKGAISEGVFGAADGMVSLLGFLAGAMVAHTPAAALLVMAAGSAVAAAVSMAGGDWLSGKTVALSLVMGLATLVGSLVPALPIVLISGAAGIAVSAVLTVALGVLIAEVRSRTGAGRLHGYLSTFGVLAVASGLAIAVTLLLGVAA